MRWALVVSQGEAAIPYSGICSHNACGVLTVIYHGRQACRADGQAEQFLPKSCPCWGCG